MHLHLQVEFSGLGSVPDPANNSKNVFRTASNIGSSSRPSDPFGGGGTIYVFGNSTSSTPQTRMGYFSYGNAPSNQGFVSRNL
uniref:Uncharacterized protein n=1 Tax=Lepeophtheirus salmonis TaxID=72036 RepID=A0A0K2TI39_LEPSM